MKVLFSNPPQWVRRDADGYWLAGIRAGSRWPFSQAIGSSPDCFRWSDYLPYPHFMGYATTYLRRAAGPGASIVFRDSIALRESYDRYFDHLELGGYDFIVIESASPSWEHDRKLIEEIHKRLPPAKIVVTGPIASDDISRLPFVHAAVKGEYEKGVARVVLDGESGLIEHDMLTQDEMNAAPPPHMESTYAWRYWDACPVGQKAPQLQAWSSRGCVYKCLAGNTPVNTVFGLVPIQEMVDLQVPVFSYDQAEKRAKVCTGLVRKTGEHVPLVRVRFDDGSHLDVTADHRFLQFKWGNQHVGEKEWEVEAKDLKKGAHVRALKTYPCGKKRDHEFAAWSRRGRELVHRMVAEWKFGRRLAENEIVHHDDHDGLNNLPGNMIIVQSQAEHYGNHPEIAERMRKNNPTKNGVSQEWRDNLSKGNKGKVRSEEAKERYRAAAKKREAAKSFEERSAQAKRGIETRKRRKNGEIINHRVVSVDPLPGLHDTYCMEVPETGWFYANNVLVHNCCFCVFPAVMTGNDPDGTKTRKVRFYSPAYMEDYLSRQVAEFGFKSIYMDDDTFNLSDRHTIGMCEVMKRIGLPWSAMCRADTIKPETWGLMKESGCFGVKVGVESGNQQVLDTIVNKRLDLDDVRSTVTLLKKLGMSVHGTFTFGLPGETREQMQDTKRFIASLPLDSLQESGTACIEGTPLHTLEKVGKLKAYPGAEINDDYRRESDGAQKIARMAVEELR